MKKAMNRIMSCILALTMILVLVPALSATAMDVQD